MLQRFGKQCWKNLENLENLEEKMEKSLEKPENSAQNARLHMITLANPSVPSSSPLPPANRSCPFSDKNIESTFSSPSAFLGHSASMLLPDHLASVHSLHFSERHVHVPYECFILSLPQSLV
jgi:hypothetical protein